MSSGNSNASKQMSQKQPARIILKGWLIVDADDDFGDAHDNW